jgi:hypothetical protein
MHQLVLERNAGLTGTVDASRLPADLASCLLGAKLAFLTEFDVRGTGITVMMPASRVERTPTRW